MSTPPQVRVGVGLFLLYNGRFLTGVRKGSLGAGQVALPGGHLEVGESFEECSKRELEEETGLRPRTKGEIKFLTATNSIFPPPPSTIKGGEGAGKQYVTIFMLWDVSDDLELGEPQTTEPEKCEGWRWTTWSELKSFPPDSLFLPINNLFATRPEISL